MSAHVLRGDARRIPLRDNSVDLIVTSPPYFGLRSYGAGEGEIGAEGHWREWLVALVEATAEMARVLKPEGSMFIDLGDKYASSGGHADDGGTSTLGGRLHVRAPNSASTSSRRGWADIPAKSLMLLPERYRIACVDQLGLICRAVIVWSKPNGLPESVQDRVRRSHEDWVHLVRGPRYYVALDEIREAQMHPQGTQAAGNSVRARSKIRGAHGMDSQYDAPNPLGKLPGSVWSIPSEPLRLPPWIDAAHYAAFGTEWPRRLILGWSPSGICLECGRGRFPVAQVASIEDRRGRVQGRQGDSLAAAHGPDGRSGERYAACVRIVGCACACTPYTDHPERRRPSVTQQNGQKLNDQQAWEQAGGRKHGNDWPERQPVREYHLDRWNPPPTHPAVVLDPFGGTGTTAHAAHALGRIGISLDLSEAYCKLAADRTLAAQRAAKVHGRVNRERQLELFGGVA
jgi:DNA modification methylase